MQVYMHHLFQLDLSCSTMLRMQLDHLAVLKGADQSHHLLSNQITQHDIVHFSQHHSSYFNSAWSLIDVHMKMPMIFCTSRSKSSCIVLVVLTYEEQPMNEFLKFQFA